jgi:hypothetical protein
MFQTTNQAYVLPVTKNVYQSRRFQDPKMVTEPMQLTMALIPTDSSPKEIGH